MEQVQEGEAPPPEPPEPLAASVLLTAAHLNKQSPQKVLQTAKLAMRRNETGMFNPQQVFAGPKLARIVSARVLLRVFNSWALCGCWVHLSVQVRRIMSRWGGGG